MPVPYTNPWDDTVPAGSDNANQIDDFIRDDKLNVQERMVDIAVWPLDPDITTPVTLLPDAVDAATVKTGLETITGWEAGTRFNSNSAWTTQFADARSISPFNLSGALIWIMPIRLPVGAILTDYKMMIDPGDESPAAAAFTLYKQDLSTGVAPTVIDTGVAPGGNLFQVLQLSAPITETIVADFKYYVLINLVNGSASFTDFYGGGPVYDSAGANLRI